MTLTEQLRSILESYVKVGGMSIRQLSIHTGVPYAVMYKFYHGGDIALSTADRLAAWFGAKLDGGKRRYKLPHRRRPRELETGTLRLHRGEKG